MGRRLKAAYFRAFFKTAAGTVPRRFAVVTAFNPRGRRSPAAANRRRDAALRRRLAGLKPFRVTGGNETGTHREPGWGFAAPPPVARGLALAFDQDAFYWISGGRIYLGAAGGGRLRPAGSWKARRARWT